MLEPLAEEQLGLLARPRGLENLLARDGKRERRQVLAREVGRDIARREKDLVVATLHPFSIAGPVAGPCAPAKLQVLVRVNPRLAARESDSRLRRFFSDLQAEGTPYMKLGRIVEGLFLGPSHYSIGLQCADLVVAATAAAERGIGQGSGYVRRLEPRFARHPSTGAIEGVGLKRFPEREPRERERHRLF